MEMVGFYGSPREGGNSSLLLDEALRVLRASGARVSSFVLNELSIRPCQNCGGCDETGACVIRDDMDLIYPALRSAARIVVASPVFFAGIPAQAKAMIDRCQALWCEKYLLARPIPPGPDGRKGLFLAVGGMRTGRGVECANATITAFFRSISVPEHRTCGYRGVDAKGAILEHADALREVREAARELAAP